MRHSGQTVQFPQMNFNLLFIQYSQSVVTFTDRNYPACTPQAEPQRYSDWSVQIYVVGKLTELDVSSTPAHKVSIVRGGGLTTKGGRGGSSARMTVQHALLNLNLRYILTGRVTSMMWGN